MSPRSQRGRPRPTTQGCRTACGHACLTIGCPRGAASDPWSLVDDRYVDGSVFPARLPREQRAACRCHTAMPGVTAAVPTLEIAHRAVDHGSIAALQAISAL